MPGWDADAGCILLGEGTSGNHVVESLDPTGKTFPLGTNLCMQIADLTDDETTEEYDGANHISGYSACMGPDWNRILEHLKEIHATE